MSFALINGPTLRWLADNPPQSLARVSAGVGRDRSNTRRALMGMATEGTVRLDDKGLWSITDDGRRVLAGLDIAEGKSAPPADPTRVTLPYDRFYPDPDQPRVDFDADAQMALNHSIRESGQLQPILVHPADPDGRHRIIAGERRWRAAQWANAEVDAVIRAVPDPAQLLDLQLTENAQRLGLNPMEEARNFQRRLDLGGSTAAIARTVGASQRFVQQRLQLLKLDPAIQARLARREITVEDARRLVQDHAPQNSAPGLGDAEPGGSGGEADEGGQSTPARHAGEGGAVDRLEARTEADPDRPRPVAHIKLSPAAATALAELSVKTTLHAAPGFPDAACIVDDGPSQPSLMALHANHFLEVRDTHAGLIARVTPDGFAWLAANYPPGVANTDYAKAPWRTPWLNTDTPIAPHAAADRTPAVDGGAASAPSPQATATAPAAAPEPGAVPPPTQTAPGSTAIDPDACAARLFASLDACDAHGVYLAVVALMREASTPEASAEALRKANAARVAATEEPG